MISVFYCISYSFLTLSQEHTLPKEWATEIIHAFIAIIFSITFSGKKFLQKSISWTSGQNNHQRFYSVQMFLKYKTKQENKSKEIMQLHTWKGFKAFQEKLALKKKKKDKKGLAFDYSLPSKERLLSCPTILLISLWEIQKNSQLFSGRSLIKW